MPEYRIPVDLRNPGQFFACCGLFELAELASPGAAAHFSSDSTFVFDTQTAVPPRILLGDGEDLADKPYDATLEPLVIRVEGEPLTLSWWLNETRTAKTALKTWGGQQTPRRVLSELLGLLDYSIQPARLFDTAVYSKSRFGVDPRSAWEALDAGYSPNDIGQEAATFPWVEVLAVAGLQGFRPAGAKRRYRYSAWGVPLPVAVARAACAAPWSGLDVQSFGFELATRGQGYKTFLFAEEATNVRAVGTI